MGEISSITFGVVSAFGGFIDMGELVTFSAAEAQYKYALIWTVVVGVCGIILHADMSGRVTIHT